MSSNIRILRVCEYCNKTFTACTTKTRYCSKQCNSKNYKKAVNNAKIEAVNKEFLQKKLKPAVNSNILDCKPYLTIKETCLLLNASDSTIRKLIRDRILPTMRIGKKHLIRKIDIDKQFKLAK